MSTINVENETNNRTNGEQSEQIVIQTQPKTAENQEKPKMSSTEELALLGLRPNSENPDPCLCFCCVFCLEACLSPTGGAPPIPPHKRLERKALGKHNWDNDSHDGDDHQNDGMEWAVTMAYHLNNTDGHHLGGHTHDGGHHGGDGGHHGGGDGHCGDGGHGGDGGGCDGGGGGD